MVFADVGVLHALVGQAVAQRPMANRTAAAASRWLRARCPCRAARAAFAPHAPCTPPPGWAEDDARYRPVTGVSGRPSPGVGRNTNCWCIAVVPPLIAPPTRLALCSAICGGA